MSLPVLSLASFSSYPTPDTHPTLVSYALTFTLLRFLTFTSHSETLVKLSVLSFKLAV